MAKSLVLIFAVLLLILNLDSVSVMANRQRRQRKDKEERDITAKEVEEITDDSEIKDDEEDLDKKQILQEWDLHMKDFVPEDMLTVELNQREELVSVLLVCPNLLFCSLFMRMHQATRSI